MYFERLIAHKNSECMSAYEQDIEMLLVFVYKNRDYYSYYISTEIKEIIIKNLSDMYRLSNNFIEFSIEMLQDYGVEVIKKIHKKY